MNIYVASSWRNQHQAQVVKELREMGHEVYDFKDSDGFSWKEIDPNWQSWTTAQYLLALNSDLARKGFKRDMDAIKSCDLMVMVQPCGCSAFMEAGWAAGADKGLVIYVPETREPDLMVLMADFLSTSWEEIKQWITDQNNLNL